MTHISITLDKNKKCKVSNNS